MKIPFRDILLGLILPALLYLAVQVQDLKVAVARVEERIRAAENIKTAVAEPQAPKTSLAFDL